MRGTREWLSWRPRRASGEAAERTPDGAYGIRAVGMNPHAAVSYFADDRLGTLEVGRLADVVVLDRATCSRRRPKQSPTLESI